MYNNNVVFNTTNMVCTYYFRTKMTAQVPALLSSISPLVVSIKCLCVLTSNLNTIIADRFFALCKYLIICLKIIFRKFKLQNRFNHKSNLSHFNIRTHSSPFLTATIGCSYKALIIVFKISLN